jgi:hypothetical protein
VQSLYRRRDGHVEAIRETASGSETAADQTLGKATAGHADHLRGGSRRWIFVRDVPAGISALESPVKGLPSG